jgi:hypothetical protein
MRLRDGDRCRSHDAVIRVYDDAGSLIETHTSTRIAASLEVVGYSAVESSPLTELWRADSDAAAVTQFVDRVENVDDIEADFNCGFFRDLDSA